MKPQPMAEIVIKQPSEGLLWIWMYSPDAAAWIEQEAPQFGSYHEPDFTGHAHLFVGGGYDINEVISYLASGGN